MLFAVYNVHLWLIECNVNSETIWLCDTCSALSHICRSLVRRIYFQWKIYSLLGVENDL